MRDPSNSYIITNIAFSKTLALKDQNSDPCDVVSSSDDDEGKARAMKLLRERARRLTSLSISFPKERLLLAAQAEKTRSLRLVLPLSESRRRGSGVDQNHLLLSGASGRLRPTDRRTHNQDLYWCLDGSGDGRAVELGENHSAKENQWTLQLLPNRADKESDEKVEANVTRVVSNPTDLPETSVTSAAAKAKQQSDLGFRMPQTVLPPASLSEVDRLVPVEGAEATQVATSLFAQSSGFHIDSFQSTQSGRDTNRLHCRPAIDKEEGTIRGDLEVL